MLDDEAEEFFNNNKDAVIEKFRRFASELRKIEYNVGPDYAMLYKRFGVVTDGTAYLAIDPDIAGLPYDKFILNVYSMFDDSKPLVVFDDDTIDGFPGDNYYSKFNWMKNNCLTALGTVPENLVRSNTILSGDFTNRWDIDDSYYSRLSRIPGIITVVFDEVAPSIDYKLGNVETVYSFETRLGCDLEDRLVFPV